MHLHLAELAHDRDTERYRGASRHHVADGLATRRRPDRGGPVRRAAARALARISLASAAAVRRIDGRIADELERPVVCLDGR